MTVPPTDWTAKGNAPKGSNCQRQCPQRIEPAQKTVFPTDRTTAKDSAPNGSNRKRQLVFVSVFPRRRCDGPTCVTSHGMFFCGVCLMIFGEAYMFFGGAYDHYLWGAKKVFNGLSQKSTVQHRKAATFRDPHALYLVLYSNAKVRTG
jgi:hypothetical protein